MYILESQEAQDYSVAKDITTWLTEIHSLRIYGGWNYGMHWKYAEQTCDLLRNATAKCTAVENLTIDALGNGVGVDSVIKQVNFSRLKTLNIRGAQWTNTALQNMVSLSVHRAESKIPLIIRPFLLC